MATKRPRPNNTWQYTIKRKGLLPKPLYLTFDDEAQGDRYVAALEAQLDAGILPADPDVAAPQYALISDLIRGYLANADVADSDRRNLSVLHGRIGGTKLRAINYPWVEAWIGTLKQHAQLSPSTIRHQVGALARCFDWAGRRNVTELLVNPLRMLPKRYATYGVVDAMVVRAQDRQVPVDVERDRRLAPEEEVKIRQVLDREIVMQRERPLDLAHQAALEFLFDLALETAMRMSEMFTLEVRQVDLKAKTAFLEKTKNGDKRQVPLSSVALAAMKRYQKHVQAGSRGMDSLPIVPDLLFPWWDGTKEGRRATTARLSRQFARIFDAAGCGDLRFHDLRHEATSRLFERTSLSDLQIAKITGHKDPRMLRRYANLRGSDLAARLW